MFVLFLAPFALPPVSTVAVWLLVGTLLLAVRRALKDPVPRVAFRRFGRFLAVSPALIYLALMGASIADQILDPVPLPRTTITRAAGADVSGPLLTIANGSVYVRTQSLSFVTIPEAHVRSLHVYSSSKQRAETMFEQVAGIDSEREIRRGVDWLVEQAGL